MEKRSRAVHRPSYLMPLITPLIHLQKRVAFVAEQVVRRRHQKNCCKLTIQTSKIETFLVCGSEESVSVMQEKMGI